MEKVHAQKEELRLSVPPDTKCRSRQHWQASLACEDVSEWKTLLSLVEQCVSDWVSVYTADADV